MIDLSAEYNACQFRISMRPSLPSSIFISVIVWSPFVTSIDPRTVRYFRKQNAPSDGQKDSRECGRKVCNFVCPLCGLTNHAIRYRDSGLRIVDLGRKSLGSRNRTLRRETRYFFPTRSGFNIEMLDETRWNLRIRERIKKRARLQSK